MMDEVYCQEFLHKLSKTVEFFQEIVLQAITNLNGLVRNKKYGDQYNFLQIKRLGARERKMHYPTTSRQLMGHGKSSVLQEIQHNFFICLEMFIIM